MEDLTISDENLTSIKEKVVLITGGASGIGRATAQLCLYLGAYVVIGDLNSPRIPFENSNNLKFVQTDVADWESLRNLFIETEKWFGRIDHVFAGAGLSMTPDFMEIKLDENGLLSPPNTETVDVNLTGSLYTAHLAIAYMTQLARNKTTGTGSIVLIASSAGFYNFPATDYALSKHGVVGLTRGLSGKMKGRVRVNCVAPSWTDTEFLAGFVDLLRKVGSPLQPPEVVARSVALLFADQERTGDIIYSVGGRYKEINNQKGGLLQNAREILCIPEKAEGFMEKLVEFQIKHLEQKSA
ncbi:uncharacterized protein N7483_002202 [Penicillium malachiteum]|uniref:uncharacterized protein n=1 Tax=Penicillium malachiteum TaxID=1324776 RepID=UPI00254830BD|nr:uncharacterized protein N7483_002202 [Penicillium malachiteum]KAJ5737077.1 hypothetical protein N7483_002202 [Penicillium malachiteum]